MVKIHRREIGAGERSSARAPARRPTRTARTSVILKDLRPLERRRPALTTVRRRSPRRVWARDNAEISLEAVGVKIEEAEETTVSSKAVGTIERLCEKMMGKTLGRKARMIFGKAANYLFGEEVSVGVGKTSYVRGLSRGSQLGRFYRLEGYRGTFKVIGDKDLGRGLSFLNLVREDVTKGYWRRIGKLYDARPKPKQGSFERLGKFVLETAKEGKGWEYLMPGCLKKPEDK
jgi:hypothetical protein